MAKKKSSEYKRGYKNVKKQMKEYRSFFKNKEGDMIGYTKTGSKQIVARKEDLNYRKGYWGGMSKAMKEAIKERPTKTRTQKPKRMIDISTMGVKHERAGTQRWDKSFTNSRWGGKRRNII